MSDRSSIPKAIQLGLARLRSFQRPVRVLLIFAAAALTLWSLSLTEQSPPVARLHLLVPSTSSNANFCKLLLSAQILQYPTPVLINYGDAESDDAYVQHLAKVEGILKYLNAIERWPDYTQDIVLIVDGWDVWFQLPPEVLLHRYFQLNAAADAHISKLYGREAVEANDLRQTVLFGPDKICWPTNFSRPACWAAQNTTLPDGAFGPGTSDGRGSHNQPRWLNSGTILGPVQDLRALFVATMEEIQANPVTNSDQFYFAEVFGRQEFARLQHRSDLLESYRAVKYREDFEIDGKTNRMRNPDELRKDAAIGGRRNEFHIGIDHHSSLFQTVAFWKQYLAWMRRSDSWVRPTARIATQAQQYSLHLPPDIEQLQSPFRSLRKGLMGSPPSWQEVDLLYNTVTKEVPALVHFTGDKTFRDVWWQKIWYQTRAKELREASVVGARGNDGAFGPAGGVMWHNAQPAHADALGYRGVDGVWTDKGDWLSWEDVCQIHEEAMYEIRGDGLYHSRSKHERDG